jgi:2-dehydropantoate 2-reductase
VSAAKVCVFGAGAVGGHIAVRLANSGNEVSVIARGATAAAISGRGLKLQSASGELTARPRVHTDTGEAGPQDVVFVAVKSMSIPEIAGQLPALCGTKTAFVFVVNGIPWWYPHGLAPGRQALPDLGFLDPGGRLHRAIGMERVLGSVVYSGNELLEPGVVKNHSAASNTVSIGELSAASSGRAAGISRMLEAAGFKSPIAADIRKAVWTKLITSNLASFPICTLLNAPLAVFGKDAKLAGVAKAILREGIAVAAAHGVAVEVDPEAVYDPARMNSPHKPSMVQDFARGKPLEIDGVLVAVQKFAEAAKVPMPHFDALMAVLVQRAVDAGLYTR